MPNVCGGSQYHPAYNSSTKLQKNEVLIGNNLYIINLKEGSVMVENVDGGAYAMSVHSHLPRQVKAKLAQMIKSSKKIKK